MSHHNKEFPRQAELNKSLKDHGLEVKKPSQLADAFRFGWRAMFELAAPSQPEGAPTGWPPGMLQDDDRKLSRALAATPHARAHADEAAEAIRAAQPEGAEPVMWQGRRAYHDAPEWDEWSYIHPDNLKLWQEKTVEKPHMFQLRALYAHPSQSAGAAAPDEGEAKRWLVFNVGCIECGVSSNVVGRYASEDEARKVAEACDKALSWREGGQNAFEVFDLHAKQPEEYVAALSAAKGEEPQS